MGHLRKRGNNWQVCIYTDRGRYHETVKGTKQEAMARMHQIEADRCRGSEPPRVGKLTLGQHLDAWLVHERTQVSQRTYDGYESIVRVHLRPALGSLSLAKLHPQALQSYYARACSGGLSPRSVTKHHRVIYSALKYAVRQGLIVRNVAELADPPRWKPKTMRTLTVEELARLLEHCTDRMHPVVYVAASTGLRLSEVLGLRWRDLNLDEGSISVNQVLYMRRGEVSFKEPKTARSRRRVSMTAKLLDFLTGYRQDRRLLGMPTKDDDLVLCHRDGAPISPSTVDHAFSAIVKAADLPGLRFHDLRHTFASISLMRGASPKVISETLGHSSVAFTMDVYSHVLPGMQDSMMQLVNDIMPSGTNRRIDKEA